MQHGWGRDFRPTWPRFRGLASTNGAGEPDTVCAESDAQVLAGRRGARTRPAAGARPRCCPCSRGQPREPQDRCANRASSPCTPGCVACTTYAGVCWQAPTPRAACPRLDQQSLAAAAHSRPYQLEPNWGARSHPRPGQATHPLVRSHQTSATIYSAAAAVTPAAPCCCPCRCCQSCPGWRPGWQPCPRAA